ncbi:MAG: hypothetical protein JWQ43_1650 [Glaciihabitans sp.]|nr:hypothetical protein [Glaciihabitans sp.]
MAETNDRSRDGETDPGQGDVSTEVAAETAPPHATAATAATSRDADGHPIVQATAPRLAEGYPQRPADPYVARPTEPFGAGPSRSSNPSAATPAASAAPNGSTPTSPATPTGSAEPTGSATPTGPAEPLVARPRFSPLDPEYSAAELQARPRTREFVRVDTNTGLVEYVPGEFVPRGNGRDATRARRANRLKRSVPGISSLALAIISVVLLVIGIQLAVLDNYTFSTAVAYVTMATSVIGFVLGVVAVFTNRGRSWAIPAIPVCLFANPSMLTWLLDAASTLIPT